MSDEISTLPTIPSQPTTEIDDTEARWPALMAALAVGGLSAALPASLSLGPRWLVPVLIGLLLIPTVVAYRNGHHHVNQWLGLILNSVVTLALIGSVVRLVLALPAHIEAPKLLLFSALSLWISNVLVFASWYWRLDAGGPHLRDARQGHCDGAFLFPQMTMSAEILAQTGQQNWSPGFIDYLFLAFNTSTALSPTDSPVLTSWAKILMMIQSSISLIVIVLLAARAVNIL